MMTTIGSYNTTPPTFSGRRMDRVAGVQRDKDGKVTQVAVYPGMEPKDRSKATKDKNGVVTESEPNGRGGRKGSVWG